MDINVFFQNNDYVKDLERQRDEAAESARLWKAKYDDLSRDYGGVVIVNIELCDTLKANGIRFRSSADTRRWPNKTGEVAKLFSQK